MQPLFRLIDLDSMSKDDFEELCHRLLLAAVDTGVEPFGAGGTDGARDAILNTMAPTKYKRWKGSFVFQYKHHDVRGNIIQARQRILTELPAEYRRLVDYQGGYPPDNYIMLTNVVFTGVRKRGTHDRMKDAISGLKQQYGSVQNIDYWDGSKIRSLLCLYPEIARAFFDDMSQELNAIWARLGDLVNLHDKPLDFFVQPALTVWRQAVEPEDAYYQGTATQWRHILANQDVFRRRDTAHILRRLCSEKRNCILLSESGQGKSALMYRTAWHYRDYFNVVELRNVGFDTDEKLDLAVLELQQFSAADPRPILVLIDDITRRKRWDDFLSAVSQLAHVHVLATSRRDEWRGDSVALSGKLNEYTPVLDEDTAWEIYERLRRDGVRRPELSFELAYRVSRSSMLEYVTYLTRGERLREVLKPQLARLTDPQARQLVRLISTAHAFGLSLSYDAIERMTGLGSRDLEPALRVSEFIRFNRVENRFQGLHELRSAAICELLHADFSVEPTLRELRRGLDAELQLRLAERMEALRPDWLPVLKDLMRADLPALCTTARVADIARLFYDEPAVLSEIMAYVETVLAQPDDLEARALLLELSNTRVRRDCVQKMEPDRFVARFCRAPINSVVALELAHLTYDSPNHLAQLVIWLAEHIAALENDVREHATAKSADGFWLWQDLLMLRVLLADRGRDDGWQEAYARYAAACGDPNYLIYALGRAQELNDDCLIGDSLYAQVQTVCADLVWGDRSRHTREGVADWFELFPVFADRLSTRLADFPRAVQPEPEPEPEPDWLANLPQSDSPDDVAAALIKEQDPHAAADQLSMMFFFDPSDCGQVVARCPDSFWLDMIRQTQEPAAALEMLAVLTACDPERGKRIGKRVGIAGVELMVRAVLNDMGLARPKWRRWSHRLAPLVSRYRAKRQRVD